MGSIDEQFFYENVIKVNKMVAMIMLSSAIVPLSFIILTLIGIWIVPHSYSFILLVYSFLTSFFLYIMNKKQIKQTLMMYVGMIFTIIFVAYLGYNEVIKVSICFAFSPFLSCLYYNKKLTTVTTIITYLSIALVYINRSIGLSGTFVTYTSPLIWYIANFSGVTIEFLFVFILVNLLSEKTHNSLQKIVITSEERNRALENLQEKVNELSQTQYEIIQFVSKCLGSHDLFTGRHVIHTQKYVGIISNELVNQNKYKNDLTEEKIKTMMSAAFLHDIGKLHIPEGILNKVGKFTKEEFELMKCHPTEGKKLLEFLPIIDDGNFNIVAKNMAYCHHEKWDGSGYPQGLKGGKIPLEARIMAAADVLDALISQRLYKDPMTIDEAVEVFKKSRGSHFEDCIADAVINSKDIIELVDANFKTIESEDNNCELQWWLRYHENKSE